MLMRFVQLAGELRGFGFPTGTRGTTTAHSLWRSLPLRRFCFAASRFA
jgi:hypothetical protein